MSPLDEKAIIRRIDQLLKTQVAGSDQLAAVVGALQSTLTLTATVYGTDSQQEAMLVSAVENAEKAGTSHAAFHFKNSVWPAVQGTLTAMKGDVEGGLLSDISRRAIGEVVADFLGLAARVLEDDSEPAKNVAGVLVAAAFEDTIRKMGASFADVHDRRDLADVLGALRGARVIEGATFSTAQNYLGFRNAALHANWERFSRADVASCRAFVEQLVMKHFA